MASKLLFWRKQVEQRNEPVWTANWGKLNSNITDEVNQNQRKKQEPEEVKRMKEEITKLFKVNKWSTQRMTIDKEGKVEMNAKMWLALGECSKSQIKKLHSYKSSAEPIKESKEGPEPEKTHKCEECGKMMATKASLANHKWAAHRKNIPMRQLVISTGNGDEHQCFICKKNIQKQLVSDSSAVVLFLLEVSLKSLFLFEFDLYYSFYAHLYILVFI
jgi:hypothetical protein